MTSQKYVSLRETIRAAAASAGAVGITTTDFSGYEIKQVQNGCSHLCEMGELYRAKVGHKTVRYFARDTWAKDYENSHTQAAPVRLSSMRRAQWEPPPKGVITPTEGITKQTLITRCPSPHAAFIHTGTYEP